MLRKMGVLLASLAMVLVSSLALVLIPATQAAAEWDMHNGGRTTGDSPPGNPDPGGKWVYDPPPGLHFEGGDCSTTIDSTFCLGYIQGNPAPDVQCYALGDGTRPTSYGALMNDDGLMVGNPWCNYPPKPTETDVWCPVSVSIEAFGPMSDPGPPVALTFREKKSAWNQSSTSRKDASLCAGTVHLDAGLNYKKLGKYRMDVIETKRSCTKVNYVGAQASVIKDCGVTNADTNRYRGQQWCGGTEPDWADHGHDFTMEECTRDNPTIIKCNEPSVRLDGLLGLHEILDDGKKHKAVWQGTSLSGSAVVNEVNPVDTVVKVWRKVTEDDPDDANPSTPWRVGKLQDSSLQPFQGVPGVGGEEGDSKTMEGLQWHAPSMPGSPWILNRWVTVKSKFQLKSTKIVAVDLTSDNNAVVEQEPVNSYFTDTVECQSKPLQVTVKRARNFR